MLILPDTVKTETDLETFFAGVRYGVHMRDECGVRPGATVEGLLSDLKIFEKHAKELLLKKDDGKSIPWPCLRCSTRGRTTDPSCGRCGGKGVDPVLKRRIDQP